MFVPDDVDPAPPQRAQLQPLSQDEGAEVRSLRALQGCHHTTRRSQEEKQKSESEVSFIIFLFFEFIRELF